jgi:hypothetical protein
VNFWRVRKTGKRARPGARARTCAGLALLAAVGLGAAGCSAQPLSENPSVKGVTDKLNITTTVPPPADFVAKSRPPSMDYMPVGVVPPARAMKPRDPAKVKELEAEMVATRVRHDRLGGRKPPAPAKPKAAGADKAAAKPPGAPL